MSYRTFGLFCFLAGLVTSGCDLASVCGRDDDGDGINNCEDVCLLHYDNEIIDARQFEKNPDCNCDDTDEDGIIDCFDPCPKHADVADKGVCGCGISPEGEGIYMTCPETSDVEDKCPNDPNKLLPGVCGCGVSDRLIVWDDDALTEGNPKSECPATDNLDLCPFDPDKQLPGICGCGIPDTDTDGDGVPDCNDRCPEDALKWDNPGACGCGVEDSAVNLMDTDKDGTVDCLDECPNNPYKIIPGPTGCDHWDTDGDGVEDQDDPCPFNPEIHALDDEGNAPDCNYITNEDGNTVFRVWNARDLERMREEIQTFIPKSQADILCKNSSEKECVEIGNYEVSPCTTILDWDSDYESCNVGETRLLSCQTDPIFGFNIRENSFCPLGCTYDFDLWFVNYTDVSCITSYTTYSIVCGDKQGMCLNKEVYYDCQNNTYTNCLCQDDACFVCHGTPVNTAGNIGDCCNPSEYTESCSENNQLLQCKDGLVTAVDCVNQCDSKDSVLCITQNADEPPFYAEIMNDIDLETSVKCDPKAGDIGNYKSFDLYNTHLNGNGHTIRFSKGDGRCKMSSSMFENILNSAIYNLIIDIDIQGSVNGAIATYISDSIIKNVKYTGNVMVDTSINGESAVNGERCELFIEYHFDPRGGYDYYYKECNETVFGAYAGYVNNSLFQNVEMSGSIASRLKDIQLTGFIGISNNVAIDNLKIDSDYISAPNAVVSPFVIKSFNNLSLHSSSISIDEIDAYSFYGFEEGGENTTISDTNLFIDLVQSKHYYPFVGVGSYYIDDIPSDTTFYPDESCESETIYYDGPPTYCYPYRPVFYIGNETKSCDEVDYCHSLISNIKLSLITYQQNQIHSEYIFSSIGAIAFKDFSFYGSLVSSKDYDYLNDGKRRGNESWSGLLSAASSIENTVISLILKNGSGLKDGPVLNSNYSTANVSSIYWLTLKDSIFGFGKHKPENDDGSVYIPFTPSQTDDIVSRLGDKWTKKLVSFHNPETNADEEIYVPWLKSATDE